MPMAEKDLVYRGKSKDVFNITEGPYAGKYRLVFTDRAAGYIENGKTVFDPGYDTVVGDIPSHYIDTITENEMIVEPALPLCMPVESPEFPGSAPLLNLEFTWRNNATGSFWRRYPFVKPCKSLHKVVEAWTKGDSDILITMEALEATGAMSKDEIGQSVELVKNIAEIVSHEFALKNLHVIDGKFELGRLKYRGEQIVLIDEISPDVLRVCRRYSPDKNGDCTVYEQCTVTNYSDGKRTIKNRNQVSASDFKYIVL
jgi:phosphoribosylaminoimidazole-succinocarboxamide synthase